MASQYVGVNHLKHKKSTFYTIFDIFNKNI